VFDSHKNRRRMHALCVTRTRVFFHADEKMAVDEPLLELKSRDGTCSCLFWPDARADRVVARALSDEPRDPVPPGGGHLAFIYNLHGRQSAGMSFISRSGCPVQNAVQSRDRACHLLTRCRGHVPLSLAPPRAGSPHPFKARPRERKTTSVPFTNTRRWEYCA